VRGIDVAITLKITFKLITATVIGAGQLGVHSC